MPTTKRPEFAIVHEFLVRPGGAERVVLSLCKAFPEAPVYTAIYRPDGTFPEFRDIDVRPTRLDRVPGLGSHHRLSFPFLARTFSNMRIDAGVTIASSIGWSHMVQPTGKKVIYCHTPPRWLYYPTNYLPGAQLLRRVLLRSVIRRLQDRDKKAALSADLYISNSHYVARRVRDLYGIDSEVIHPPPNLDSDGLQNPVFGLPSGYLLVVARLLPYKRVDLAIVAANQMKLPLAVVGTGPEDQRLRAISGPTVRFLGDVSDAQLRWLYANASALICAGIEDYGLSPIEAFQFGTPVVALRAGGYLETVREGVNGIFVAEPKQRSVTAAIESAAANSWDPRAIRLSAAVFSEAAFAERAKALVGQFRSSAR